MATVPLLAPEALLAAAAVCAALLDVFLAGRRREIALLAAFAAVVAAVLAIAAGRGAVDLGATRFAVDGAAQFARVGQCALVAILCTWMAGAPATARTSVRGVVLVLLAGASGLVACGARDWLTLLVALEVGTLPLIAGLAPRETVSAGEPPVLRLLTASGAATVLAAFGVALLLASSGSLVLSAAKITGPGGWLAAALILFGLAGKLGAAPYDVPTRHAFVSAPAWAVASVAGLTRVPVAVGLARAVEAMAPQTPSSGLVLYAAGAASMLWGVAVLLRERNVRAVVARAGALNAGFVLFALGLGGAYGLRSAVFFAVACALPSMGLVLSTGDEPAPDLDAISGLARRRRLAAWALAVFSLSLVGIAPTAGFLGKLYVLGGVLRAGAVWAGALGIVVSVASAFPFVRLVRAAFDGHERPGAARGGTPEVAAALAVALAATVALGVAVGPVLALLGLRLP